jgi:hypothetical protein
MGGYPARAECRSDTLPAAGQKQGIVFPAVQRDQFPGSWDSMRRSFWRSGPESRPHVPLLSFGFGGKPPYSWLIRDLARIGVSLQQDAAKLFNRGRVVSQTSRSFTQSQQFRAVCDYFQKNNSSKQQNQRYRAGFRLPSVSLISSVSVSSVFSSNAAIPQSTGAFR